MVQMPVNAEDSGGVQASSSTVSLTPSDPVEGGSVTIRLTLYNSNNFAVEDVLYKFYWDGVASNKLIEADTIDIDAEQTVDVEVMKSGLTVGEHKVWIVFDANGGGEQMFYRDVVVSGLADLEVSTIETSPELLNSGDAVSIGSLIENTGSEDAVASRMQLDLGSQSEILDVPALQAGESAWVNHSMTAPDSGTHQIAVTVDLDDAIIEADEDNTFTSSITVTPRMDLSHQGNLSISVEEGSLQGPWVISGMLLRTGGSGTTEVPMKIEIKDQSGQDVPLPTFNVNVTGGDMVQQPWSFTLTYSYISILAPGNHQVTAVIDPYQIAPFEQETRSNDRLSGYFVKYAVPDVSVDPYASPSQGSVNSGSNVDWTVSIINSGDIEVKGRLIYSWEGVTVESTSQPILTLGPGESYIWVKTLATAAGSHTAYFDAQWVPLSGSYDDNPLNSFANGSVEVTAQLRLNWLMSNFELVDVEGKSAQFPLTSGDNYTLTIKLSSVDTGTVNYSCENELGYQYDEVELVVSEPGQIMTIECEFTASNPFSNINLIPSNSVVSSTQSWNWETKVSSEDLPESQDGMAMGTVAMIGVIVLILVGILIAAIILTREVEEEVERDIFDYCPACDGELDGEYDRCPYCTFNLKKARKQFHDCESCGESIPDLLANCPYCGADQDVSKYFERRERRQIDKETVALPEEEEEVDPETIHAAGYENFDEAVKEFGYDADDLEGHWDENIAAAEAEVEAAYDRRMAALDVEEMDDEEAMSTVTTTLKSIEETFEGHDIDSFLSDKDVQAHQDDGSELTASDAEIRGKLYEITGEEGVMPGDEVTIGMGVQDRSLAGNELPDEAMDFSFDDDEVNPVAKVKAEQSKRRGVRRRSKAVKTAECGACGADIPADATECSVCGAKFE